MKALKQTLDRLYSTYKFKERIPHDPIEFPHRYSRPEDIEVAGFIASCFAYGRVELFKPVVKGILDAMGESPHDFLSAFRPGKHRHLFRGLKYRFNRNEDIVGLLHVVSTSLGEHGRIEALFMKHFTDGDPDTGKGLAGLTRALAEADTAAAYGRNAKPYGFLQFFPSPEKGSACKRMNMFLRWMVRDRDVDFGIWKGIPKSRLVIPLDTHIARVSKCLGFTKRASQDWKMAIEVTDALKGFDPEDPLKYDFALCHQGIAKVCSKARCDGCSLFDRRNG
ncbi:MAG TPA: TIGR02757 family protein [Dissulfurispiraceae bacterium]